MNPTDKQDKSTTINPQGIGKAKPHKGRFFLVPVSIWSEETFQKNSDDARLLLICLLTGPATTTIPGLVNAYASAFTVWLGISEERVEAAVAELKADGTLIYESGVFWLPGVLEHREPVNPNFITSWRNIWPYINNGAVKRTAWVALRAWCQKKGRDWLKAFDDACPIKNPPVKVKRPWPRDGWVYFAHDAANNSVKIGFSANAAKRIRSLQTGSSTPLTLLGKMKGSEADERELHQRFCSLHIKGEWFRAEPELLTFISEVTR